MTRYGRGRSGGASSQWSCSGVWVLSFWCLKLFVRNEIAAPLLSLLGSNSSRGSWRCRASCSLPGGGCFRGSCFLVAEGCSEGFGGGGKAYGGGARWLRDVG